MYDLAIIFFYYKDCPVTKFHADQIKKHNPNIPLIPISWDTLVNQNSRWFLDTKCNMRPDYANEMFRQIRKANINTNRFNTHGDLMDWFNMDKRLYCWFDTTPVLADRYILMDWDVLVTTNLRNFYNPVWDADVAASWFITAETTPKWPWWIKSAPQFGVGPVCGMLLSHNFLSWVVKFAYDYTAFCELRLGIYAQEFGGLNQVIDWPYLSAWPIQFPTPLPEGIFHPVKKITLC